MFNWFPSDNGFRAEMPGNISLTVAAVDLRNGKPMRGTKWRAMAFHWCERTRTSTRYGRDEYMNAQATVKAARDLAESIYLRQKSPNSDIG